MKTLLIALLATSTLGLAAPAFAHDPPQVTHAGATDWNNGGDTYSEFNAEYQHIWEGIQHGVSDGSYTQAQAQQYYREMQNIRSRADMMQRSGRYDPRDIQARLERLHDVMHDAHDEGHAQQDRYGNGMSYADFDQEYRHISEGIQHGLSDGSFSRRQAQRYSRDLQKIRARADMMQRSGRYDPQYIQAQIEGLHDAMHDAHDAGHERQDRYGYDNSYNNRYNR